MNLWTCCRPTPGSVYTGVEFCKKLCGVSIIRRWAWNEVFLFGKFYYFSDTQDIISDLISIHASIDLYCCSGESMENALRACCKGIKIGKILIHRDGDNGKQVVYLLELICRCYRVFLCMQFFSLYIFCLCLRAAYIWEASQRYFRTACPPPRSSSCYWWVFIYLFILITYYLSFIS